MVEHTEDKLRRALQRLTDAARKSVALPYLTGVLKDADEALAATQEQRGEPGQDARVVAAAEAIHDCEYGHGCWKTLPRPSPLGVVALLRAEVALAAADAVSSSKSHAQTEKQS